VAARRGLRCSAWPQQARSRASALPLPAYQSQWFYQPCLLVNRSRLNEDKSVTGAAVRNNRGKAVLAVLQFYAEAGFAASGVHPPNTPAHPSCSTAYWDWQTQTGNMAGCETRPCSPLAQTRTTPPPGSMPHAHERSLLAKHYSRSCRAFEPAQRARSRVRQRRLQPPSSERSAVGAAHTLTDAHGDFVPSKTSHQPIKHRPPLPSEARHRRGPAEHRARGRRMPGMPVGEPHAAAAHGWLWRRC
jgi:hypothetical protein